jgi:hypothetical protein
VVDPLLGRDGAGDAGTVPGMTGHMSETRTDLDRVRGEIVIVLVGSAMAQGAPRAAAEAMALRILTRYESLLVDRITESVLGDALREAR